MLLRARELLFATVLMLSVDAIAAESAKESLENTIEALESSQDQQEELQTKRTRNAEELASLQRQSLGFAQEIRALENRIALRNQSLTKLETDITTKEASLKSRREEIASLLYGIIRMQRLPRQFVIASPGEADDLLRTASALSVSFNATEQAASNLQGELKNLAELKEEAAEARQELDEEKKQLAEKMTDLNSAMKERQTVQRQVDSDLEKLKSQITNLSEKSSSLKELIEQLDREQALFQALGAPRAKPKPSAPSSKTEEVKTAAFTKQKGNLAYPVAGELLHRYGQRKGPNEKYNGHVVRTGAGAMVTAPHAGRIVFADHFMDYGKMVIIQHDNNYHTVLAGLDVIRGEPGQELAVGEPVGVMGNTLNERELYLEVRKNSKAIDPAAWMGNLITSVASR
jgi:septal ring factor EnvC (AmiA/AmiB activator)